MRRHDFMDLTAEKATVTDKGWVFDNPILTRSGVFIYTRADGSTRREYRPPEEVFKPASLATLKGIPFIVEHTAGFFHEDGERPIAGTVLGDGVQDGDNLRAPIVIHLPKTLGDRRELSLAYDLDLEEKPGETPQGERYDAIQRNIRYDHLAGVKRGRAGNARLRLDHDDAASGPVETEDKAPPMKKIRLDSGVEYEAPPEVVHAYETARASLASTAANVTALQAQVTAQTARADDLNAQLTTEKGKAEAIRAEAGKAVRARVELETKATALGATFAADASDRVIREAVVKHLRGDSAVDFAGKGDEYVAAMFDLVTDERARLDAADADNNRHQNGQPPAGGGGTPPKRNDNADPHEEYRQNLANAWKGAQ